MSGIIVDPEIEEQKRIEAAEAEAAKLEAVATTTDTDPALQTDPEPGDDLPEKFRGKSQKDLVEMYRALETELGRKNNEVGVIRKFADELIGVRATERAAQANPQQKPEPLTTDQLLNDPEAAVLGVVKRAADERTQGLEQKVASLEERLLIEDFEKRHPGFQQTMQSQEFGSWLQKSEYRKRLGFRAYQGDYEAADELFGLYEENVAAASQQPQTPPTPQPKAKSATTVRPGGSVAGGVVPGGEGKKIWSRAELMEMRIKRPEEFDMRQDEILAAYREKRVR